MSSGSEWERFAAKDALFHIDPSLSDGVGVEEFIAGGSALVGWALDWAGELEGRERALEIGCGVGRNTVHFARHFARVDGVDISPTMISLAREQGPPENVSLHVTSGSDLAPFDDRAFDLVFSNLVFQHVPDEAVVAAYLDEIGRVLAPGGAAVLQFDTRRLGLGARALRRMPDRLLPASRRRHMRRYPRDADRIRELAATAGLEVTKEQSPGTAEHWMLLRPAT